MILLLKMMTDVGRIATRFSWKSFLMKLDLRLPGVHTLEDQLGHEVKKNFKEESEIKLVSELVFNWNNIFVKVKKNEYYI